MSTNILSGKKIDLIYPELSYKILGTIFDVDSAIGYGHKEKFYQNAVAEGFRKNKLKFQEQVPAKLSYKEKFLGIYYFDFLVDDKIVIELKVRNYFTKQDIDQLYSYLKAKNLKLGIIIHFTKSGVKYKRVVNIN